MRRTTFVALSATLSILGSAFTGLSSPLQAMAARPAPASAAGLDGSGFDFTPAVKPGALDPNRKVTVMLEMAGNPVAVVKSLAPGKSLSDSEKGQVENDLQGKQDNIKPSIEAEGAKVVGQYQNAYNGIKVLAPAGSVGALASLPGVVAVHPVTIHTLDNSVSVPYIGAPTAWASTGFHGENIKVAIVDTGIDYTHANFGGPGTAAAYQAALATDTLPADPTLFGPNAPKVKGGTDLVGDDYDAAAPAGSPKLIPHPDPNPLDCAGHGSHVAGTTAGFGVNANGTTYSGPYDSSIYTPKHFTIGPGVAPKADLYAVRVFGCAGSTNVVTDALDWSVKNGMQVVNMSLGSSYGNPSDPDVTATNNAVAAGVLVVASAGNSGQNPYIVGSPSIATGAISVAATDSTPTFPGAVLHLKSTTGADLGSVTAIDANGATIPSGTYPITVLTDSSGFSLGCSDADYTKPSQPVAGHIVVTRRGTCARILRAQLGANHGAVAVVMTNNAAGLPPYEGPIPGVPSSMPFLGVDAKDKTVVRSASFASMTAVDLPNPTFRQIIGFSSSGPRRIDSAFKPDITAPGVAIFSTAMGTGNQGEYLSGTSMAAPHVSGVAALTIQAHPEWEVKDIRAAIVNTGAPSRVDGYVSTAAGTGLVQPNSSVHTTVTLEHTLARSGGSGSGGDGNGNDNAADDNRDAAALVSTNLSFGFAELSRDFHSSQSFNVINHGEEDATFKVAVEQATAAAGSSPHTATVSRSSLTVSGGDQATLRLKLDVPAATAGDASAFRDVRGTVVLTPVGGSNAGVSLRFPYYMVPRSRSKVSSKLSSGFSHTSPSGTVSITNNGGTIPGSADFYAWGLSGTHSTLGEIGLRAVGVQNAGGGVGVFAVNTFARWSAPNVDEFDILIDSTPNHTGPNYLVVGIDNGLLTTGSFDGNMVAAVINMAAGTAKIKFLAGAPTDGSTIELPFLLADIGVTASNPRFTYTAQSFDDRGDLGGASDAITTPAGFNAFTSAISNGDFVTVNPGASGTSTATINPAEWAVTPAKGLMIVSLDNHSGGSQAQLIPVH